MEKKSQIKLFFNLIIYNYDKVGRDKIIPKSISKKKKKTLKHATN